MTEERQIVGTDEDWETITGLLDDADAYIANARFGAPKSEEYQQAIGESSEKGSTVHFNVDFVSEDGQLLGSQGYSVGGGWIVSEDGDEISHPARGKIVTSSVYGQLIDAVVIELAVPMKDYGTPLIASSWNGLGFHWKQKPHKTLREGEVRTAPMPTSFLGKAGETAAPAAAAPAAAKAPAKPAVAKAPAKPAAAAAASAPSTLEVKLGALARNMDFDKFQDAALKLPEVAASDDMLVQVLDSSETGFWATHQAA